MGARRGIVAAFGPGVLGADGRLDRLKVADAVFRDPAKLRQLNKITHPLINQEMMRRTRALLLRGYSTVVLDIPLLLAGLRPGQRPSIVGKTIVVKARPDVQLERLMARNGFSKEEASRRIRSQMSGEEQAAFGDFSSISGSLEELERQVADVLRRMPQGIGLGRVLAAFAAITAVVAPAFKKLASGSRARL